jgi:hypothetical protein
VVLNWNVETGSEQAFPHLVRIHFSALNVAPLFSHRVSSSESKEASTAYSASSNLGQDIQHLKCRLFESFIAHKRHIPEVDDVYLYLAVTENAKLKPT